MEGMSPALRKALAAAEKNLRPEDLTLLKELLQSTPEEELIGQLQQLAGMQWERMPVDVETFVLSPEYLGLNGSRGNVYPKLLEDVVELFNGDYDEFVGYGGIGWGKTLLMELVAAYMGYQLACLHSPQMFYGLDPAVPMAILNVSVTASQARRVFYERLRQRLEACPFFKEECRFDPNIVSEMRFQDKNFAIRPAAATESGTVGYDVYGVLMDEVNFWDVIEMSAHARGARFDQAQEIYTLLRRRIESRFPGRPGKLMVVSSSKYPDDFTERRTKEVELQQQQHEEDRRIPPPRTMIRRYSQWTTKPAGTYPPERFYLYLGTASDRPTISLERESVQHLLSDPERRELVLEVPMNFWDQFEKDIDGSIRDIAGYPTLAITPFIPQKDKIAEAFARGDAAGMKHPFTAFETTLQDGVAFDPSMLLPVKGRKYYVHVDLGLRRDACGIALGHVDEWIRREVTTDEGHETFLYLPKIIIDAALRIVPPQGGEIEIDSVRGLIMEWRAHGFNIRKVTYDQWQSASSIQALKRVGIDAENLSVDRGMEAYTAFKEALLEDRVWMYSFPHLFQEIVRLEENTRKKKVDHPPKGSKDVADAVAGVTFHCVNETPAFANTIEFGEMDLVTDRTLPPELQGLEPTVDENGRLRPGHQFRTVDDILFRGHDGEDEEEDDDFIGGYI